MPNSTETNLPAATPAWDDALLKDPHSVTDKRSRVQRMFSAIAGSYDLNNRLHSFWMDQRWRRKAVKLADIKVADVIIDVACGTGDLAIALDQRKVLPLAPVLWGEGRTSVSSVEPGKGTSSIQNLKSEIQIAAPSLQPSPPITRARGKTIGVDFTFEMLPLARQKSEIRNQKSEIWFINGDAQALPLPDACADVLSIAFGIRNVQDTATALAEFSRVLKPGGRLIILEFSQPTNRVIRWLNDLYCSRIMPHTATWISGDKSGAYKYLPMSVRTFIDRNEMVRQIRAAGFDDVRAFPMTFGVCVCYRGIRAGT